MSDEDDDDNYELENNPGQRLLQAFIVVQFAQLDDIGLLSWMMR